MKLKEYYKQERVNTIDSDFLEFEEEMILPEDLERLEILCRQGSTGLPNPHNSILLYVIGLTDVFDFSRARSDTIGGSPPDIDNDFDAIQRYKIINWTIEHWGRENVANIITHGTLKPKSLTRKWFKVVEGDPDQMKRVLDMIPDALFGKEATFEEIIKGDTEKGFKPHPELIEDRQYAEYSAAATKLENLIANSGVHAAGIVISDFPISDIVPLWSKTSSEPTEGGRNKKVEKWVTQYDMKEVETLG